MIHGRAAVAMSLFGVLAFLPLLARGQETQSLGDLSRQAREQKQNDSPTPSPKLAKVINDEDAPGQVSAPAESSKPDDLPRKGSSTSRKAEEQAAVRWKTQILAQKNLIRSTQERIDTLNQAIQFKDSEHPIWNQRQRERLKAVERLQGQLDQQKKQLDDMQEAARKQGFGNAVYDP